MDGHAPVSDAVLHLRYTYPDYLFPLARAVLQHIAANPVAQAEGPPFRQASGVVEPGNPSLQEGILYFKPQLVPFRR